jgi:hypothetical protein
LENDEAILRGDKGSVTMSYKLNVTSRKAGSLDTSWVLEICYQVRILEIFDQPTNSPLIQYKQNWWDITPKRNQSAVWRFSRTYSIYSVAVVVYDEAYRELPEALRLDLDSKGVSVEKHDPPGGYNDSKAYLE